MATAEQPEALHKSIISVPEPDRIQIGEGHPELVTIASGDASRRREMRLKSIFTYTELSWTEFMPVTLLREAHYHEFEYSHSDAASLGGWMLGLRDPATGNIFTRHPHERDVVLSQAEGVQVAAGDSLRDTVRGMYLLENLERLSTIVAREKDLAEGVSNQAQHERRRISEVGEFVASLLDSHAVKDKIDPSFFREIREISDAKDIGDGPETPMTPEIQQKHITEALARLRYRHNWRTVDPLS